MINGAANIRSNLELDWLFLMTLMKIQVPMRRYNKPPKVQYMRYPLFFSFPSKPS